MDLAGWLLAHGDDAQFVLFFGGVLLLTAAELRFRFRRTDPTRRRRWLANYGLTLLNIAALGVLPTSFVAAAAMAEHKGVGLLHQVSLPLALVVLGTLLVRSFISFVTHLLMHKVPAFWRIHRVHHLDTDMDVSTTVRFHPAEVFITLPIGVPFVVAFGLSPWVLAAYELLDVIVTLWSHADVRLPPALDRVLRYFVVTPSLHRVHHSTHPEETDSNFGAVFPIWDILLGTFRTRTSADPSTMPLGLAEVRGTQSTSLIWLLTSPLRRSLAGHD